MKSLLLIAGLCFLLLLAPARAEDSTPYEGFRLWKAESPDRKYFAAVRRVPATDYIWKEDLDSCRFVIFPQSSGRTQGLGRLYFSYYLAGRLPAQIEWTPDSEFAVFTTVSSGGHQPYRFTAYVISLERKALRSVDAKIGIVVSAAFKVTSSGAVEFQTCKEDDGIDFEHPFPITIDLNTLFDDRPKQKKI